MSSKQREVQISQTSQVRQTERSATARWGTWAVVLLALAVRLPGVDRPLLGYFSTKNVTYAMIARNWALGRSSMWRPAMDCLVGGQRGWHLLEFPASAYLTGAAWRVCGGSLDAWGRSTSAAFSAGAVAILFSLVGRWHGRAAAYGASLALALSPLAVIFGQSFMLEASLVFFSLASMWALDHWLACGRKGWLLAAAASFALLLLTKIYMLVLALPLAALVWQTLRDRVDRRGPSARRIWLEFALAGVAAVLPACAWYFDAWRVAAPESAASARVFYSIRRSAAVHHWPHPLLISPDFYKRLLDDLSGSLLTPIGFALALVGLWGTAWRRHAAWLAASALLVAALPAKFYDLPYYELALLPAGCVLAGLGWQTVYERMQPSRLGMAALLGVALAFSLRYAVKPAFTTPGEDREVLTAAAALRSLAAAGDPVATLHGASTDVLYYSDHPGWAFSINDRRLSEKLVAAGRQGARWLAAADLAALDASPFARQALAPLRLVREGPDFRIYELPATTAVAPWRHGEHGAEDLVVQ